MKLFNLVAFSIIATSSVSLFASSETDRKIEDAAKASYNYRTVLENHVGVKANDGVVTLTGTVVDAKLGAPVKDFSVSRSPRNSAARQTATMRLARSMADTPATGPP